MFALLATVLLFHHIEGVCKPKSAATLLRERVQERFMEYVAQRDTQAATQRARERGETRRQAALGRAEAVRQARDDRKAGRSGRRPQSRDMDALEALEPRPEWQQSDVQDEHYHWEG